MYPVLNNKKKIVVIGGNAAGAAAAAKAKRFNPDLEVFMVEAGEYISVGSCELPYLISGEIDDYKKIVFFDANTFREKKGVDVFLKHRVVEVSPSKRELKVLNENGNEYKLKYDKLILTTGAQSKRFNECLDAKNVFNYKTINDYLSVKESLEKSTHKQIVVVGGGFIGLEVAEALNRVGVKVLLIEKSSSVMPSAEPELQEKIQDLAVEKGIRVFCGNPTVKYYKTGDIINRISINGYSFDIDFVISVTGFQPEITLAKSAKLSIGDFGVRVNTKMQTSDSNIYSAGDCSEVIHFITKRPVYLPLATIARRGGYIAGENAAGGNRFMSQVIPNISLSFFDYYFSSTGLTEFQALSLMQGVKSYSGIASSLVEVMPNARKIFGKIITNRDREIIGGSFYGGIEISGLADIISLSIKKRLKIDELNEIDFNYTPRLSPFTNILSILSKKGI